MDHIDPSLQDQGLSGAKVPCPENFSHVALETELRGKSLLATPSCDICGHDQLQANPSKKNEIGPRLEFSHGIQPGGILQTPPSQYMNDSPKPHTVSAVKLPHLKELPLLRPSPPQASCGSQVPSDLSASLDENLIGRSEFSSTNSASQLPGANRASNPEGNSRANSDHHKKCVFRSITIPASHTTYANTNIAQLPMSYDASLGSKTLELEPTKPAFPSVGVASPLIVNISTSSTSNSEVLAVHQSGIASSDKAFPVPAQSTFSFRVEPRSLSSSHSHVSVKTPIAASQPQPELKSQKSNSDQQKRDFGVAWVQPSTNPEGIKHNNDSHQGQNWLKFQGPSDRSQESFCPVVISTLCAICIPVGCLVCNSPWLVSSERGPGGKVVLVLYCYLISIMLSSMWRVASSDAGTVPRNLDPNPDWEEEAISAHESMPWREAHVMAEAHIRPRWVNTGDYLVPTKWCRRCRTYRPPRASHCRICDICVEQSDHHCTFLNNCIGRKNYFPFLVFLLATSICMLYTITISAVHVVLISDRRHNPVAIGNYVIMGIALLLGSPVFGLLTFHLKLISQNVTTMERLRPITVQDEKSGKSKEDVPIYSLGKWYLNGLWIICRPSFGLIQTKLDQNTTADRQQCSSK